MIRLSLALVALGALLVACGERPAASAAASGAAPERIVTLAPNLAELVAAVGAGDRLVGVSAYTDYPAGLASLPRIGDAFRPDQEALLRLDPDLVLAWGGGTPDEVVARLREQGYRVEVVPTRSLADVAAALRQVGELTGNADAGEAAASRFERRLAALGGDGRRVRVFYQISTSPLYTVNGEHFISELIERCGGSNVFAGLQTLAPAVSVDAVLRANPDVILAAGAADDDTLDVWERWPSLVANRAGTRFLLPADILVRAGPRLAAGGEAVCAALDQARRRLPPPGG